jgi:hypothetical protein
MNDTEALKCNPASTLEMQMNLDYQTAYDLHQLRTVQHNH